MYSSSVVGPPQGCFDILATLWVYMYERALPKEAQVALEKDNVLDDLQASTDRFPFVDNFLCLLHFIIDFLIILSW
jgi:hypothetical protein